MTTIETIQQQIWEERNRKEALQDKRNELVEAERQEQNDLIEKHIEAHVDALHALYPSQIQYEKANQSITYHQTIDEPFEIASFDETDTIEEADELFAHTLTAIALIQKLFELKTQLLGADARIHPTRLSPNVYGLFERLFVTNETQSLEFIVDETINVDYSWGRKQLSRSFDHDIKYSDGRHITFKESFRNQPTLSFNHAFETTLETLEADIQKAKDLAEKANYSLDVDSTKATVTL